MLGCKILLGFIRDVCNEFNILIKGLYIGQEFCIFFYPMPCFIFKWIKTYSKLLQLFYDFLCNDMTKTVDVMVSCYYTFHSDTKSPLYVKWLPQYRR